MKLIFALFKFKGRSWCVCTYNGIIMLEYILSFGALLNLIIFFYNIIFYYFIFWKSWDGYLVSTFLVPKQVFKFNVGFKINKVFCL